MLPSVSLFLLLVWPSHNISPGKEKVTITNNSGNLARHHVMVFNCDGVVIFEAVLLFNNYFIFISMGFFIIRILIFLSSVGGM